MSRIQKRTIRFFVGAEYLRRSQRYEKCRNRGRSDAPQRSDGFRYAVFWGRLRSDDKASAVDRTRSQLAGRHFPRGTETVVSCRGISVFRVRLSVAGTAGPLADVVFMKGGGPAPDVGAVRFGPPFSAASAVTVGAAARFRPRCLSCGKPWRASDRAGPVGGHGRISGVAVGRSDAEAGRKVRSNDRFGRWRTVCPYLAVPAGGCPCSTLRK